MAKKSVKITRNNQSETYKVGDWYTTTRSNLKGKILEFIVLKDNLVRVKLDVNGEIRWSTWKQN